MWNVLVRVTLANCAVPTKNVVACGLCINQERTFDGGAELFMTKCFELCELRVSVVKYLP